MTRRTAFAPAVDADAGNDQTVPLRTELMGGGNCVAKRDELLTRKFDEPLATRAVKVVMLRIAVVVLIHSPSVEDHFLEQASFDHLVERPVDRRATGPLTRCTRPQIGQQLLGIKMLVPSRHMVNNRLTLPGDSLAPCLHELGKPFLRCQGGVDCSQRKIS